MDKIDRIFVTVCLLATWLVAATLFGFWCYLYYPRGHTYVKTQDDRGNIFWVEVEYQPVKD